MVDEKKMSLKIIIIINKEEMKLIRADEANFPFKRQKLYFVFVRQNWKTKMNIICFLDQSKKKQEQGKDIFLLFVYFDIL